ncbi:MAG TPA: ATP-binding cassette domain-containing protein [Candidatus Hydrothermia bacterium]|nr:ATP-binding cassette domain-containing protein [Candidatus Hydrothermae bacterium]HOL24302.1 ATP-binding cassette domain-containing protein [Candidatus Hydrothermia bacterium]HOP32835.1 ATP-binding cassette domain-containing protein [Candidatus Hydrothermia bacterium]HRD23575.1 ATP-binding cassette domain-containing protein [Candidatus Hydrothermia bacterium]
MALKLTISDIYKSYNGKEVLKGSSFSFDKSGIYVLMGPNGSGKSTLLRICALLEPPDSGKVKYLEDNNRILEDNLNLRRRLTLLLPNIGAFNTTVFKNIAYGLKIRGIKKDKIEEKVEQALDFVGLLHKKNQNALTLSSGEIKRMGIARAIVIEPEILFLDEPTTSVDHENIKIIENIMIQLKQRLNSTIIMATHDSISARRVGDFFLFLEDGRIKF